MWALKAISIVLASQLVFPASAIADSPATVDLGTASSFVVLARASISNAGATTLDGDIGSYPTAAITGLTALGGVGPGFFTGTNYGNSETTQTAMNDLNAAYLDAAGRTADSTIATDLGGQTLSTGVYSSVATIAIDGTLTLSGSATDVFILKAGSTLGTAVNSEVVLTGGAVWTNVFWVVGSSATIGVSSVFKGTILANTSITMGAGATINNGRLLAGAVAASGAVVLNANDISLPVTLSEFKLDLSGSSVHLRWITSAEIDNLGFNIQRQEADRNWLEIDSFTGDKSLAGHGSTTEEHRYTYTDSRVTPGTTFRYRLQDVDYAGKVTTHDDLIRTITTPDFKATPESFDLVGAYPNPFNPTTTISYSIPEQSIVTLTVLDIKGQELVTLQNDLQTAGNYKLQWNGKDQLGNPISAGVYFCRLHAGSSSQTIKMVYVK